MDTIRFELSKPEYIENASYKMYDVEVFLNDKSLGTDIFNAAEVLSAAKFNLAKFDLLTCSCGIPGCAGFHEEIEQIKSKGSVKWIFPVANYYQTEKLVYEFSRDFFDRSLSELSEKMLLLEREEIYDSASLMNEESYLGYDSSEVEPMYSIKGFLSEGIEWYTVRFQSAQDLNEVLIKSGDGLMEKQFHITYGDGLSTYCYSLYDLVCKINNDYPHRKSSKLFLARAKFAVKAINSACSGDNKMLLKIIKNANRKLDYEGAGIIRDEFDSLFTEHDFDMNKIGIMIKQ